MRIYTDCISNLKTSHSFTFTIYRQHTPNYKLRKKAASYLLQTLNTTKPYAMDDPTEGNKPDLDTELRTIKATYLFPYTVNYREIGRQSLLDHTAVSVGVVGGNKSLFVKLSTAISRILCCCIDLSFTHAKSEDPALNDKRLGDVFGIGIAVGTVSTLIAEICALFGMDHLVATIVNRWTSACSAGGEHHHLFGLTCAAFHNATHAMTVGVITTLVSIVLQTVVSLMNSDGKTGHFGDNVTSALCLGVTAAICTFFIKGFVGGIVASFLTEGLSRLRLRAEKCGHSFSYHLFWSTLNVRVT